MSLTKFPLFADSIEDVVEEAAITCARAVAYMEPGDKIVIERFKFEPGKSIYELTLKTNR